MFSASDLDAFSDEDLMHIIQTSSSAISGDVASPPGRLSKAQAQGMLYQRYAARIFTYLRGLGLSNSDAEDLMQEVLITALIEKYSYFSLTYPNSKVKPWIYKIADNAGKNKLRQGNREREKTTVDLITTETEQQIAAGSVEYKEDEEAAILTRIFDTAYLTPEERRFLLLDIDLNHHTDLLMQVLGITKAAVYSRRCRIKTKLRQVFADQP